MASQLDHRYKPEETRAARAASRFVSAFVAAACLVGVARADDAVVLASTPPGPAPGTIVADGQVLRLPERASLTLLFRSGEMLRLRGPLDASLAALRGAGREKSPHAMASGLRASGVDAAVIGGTRSLSSSLRQRIDTDDIEVSLEQTATYCLGPSNTLWLKRAATGAQIVGLSRAETLRQVRFPELAERIEWPADVMIEDGDRITFLSSDGTVYGTAAFRRIEAGAGAELSWLAQAGLLGCAGQFEAMRRDLESRTLLPQ